MSEPWTAARARSFFDYEAQPKEWVYVCDLCHCCGPEAIDKVADRDRYGFEVFMVACRVCGLVYQQHRLAAPGLRALYSGPYRALVSAWHGRPINLETLEPEQRSYGRKLGEMLVSHGLESDRLLDLGGSTGGVAAAVTSRMGALPGIVVEPSVAEAVAAIPRACRVIVQSAEDFEAPPGSFDLILLCQTADHLRSISSVLAKVRAWLAPGGRFFVDAVDSSLIPESERYKIDHVYALTPATMRAYLERAGFVAREVPAPSANHVAFLCEVAA